MTAPQATNTGIKTQIDLLRLSKLVDCCQLLATHLREYAATPSHFDEDAFGRSRRPNTVLFDAEAALARLQRPEEHCSDCRSSRHEVPVREWDDEAGSCWNCSPSVRYWEAKLGLPPAEDIDDARGNIQHEANRCCLDLPVLILANNSYLHPSFPMANSTTAPAHTPTLWTVDPCYDRFGCYNVAQAQDHLEKLFDAEDDELTDRANAIDHANGAFIQRACNSHEKLLDACYVALSQLTEDREEYLEDDMRQLRKAIAEADAEA